MKRLEKLRLCQKWTWEQVGEKIGLSRTMIHFLRKGKYNVTDKVQHRLELAEIEAGLRLMSSEEESVMEAYIKGWLEERMATLTPAEQSKFLIAVIQVASAGFTKVIKRSG